MKKIRDIIIIIYLIISFNEVIRSYNIISFYDSVSFVVFYWICVVFFLISICYEWIVLGDMTIINLVIATILFAINPLISLFDGNEFTIITYPMFLNIFLIVYKYIINGGGTHEEKNYFS